MDAIQTEFAFRLPVGFVDDDGLLLREGVMRRATAADEIAPLGDVRVRSNPAYLPLLVLSRVIVRLGPHQGVSPHQVERFFSEDFAYLQALYNEINNAAGEPPSLDGSGDSGAFPGNVEALPPRTNSMKR